MDEEKFLEPWRCLDRKVVFVTGASSGLDQVDNYAWTLLKLVVRILVSILRASNRKGSVINISSISGLNCGHLPGGAAYAASKAGLNAITKVMALELGKYKIRVNAISPGLFRSEITEALMEKEWLNNVAMRTVPLRKHGTTDPALTSLVRYLIHDSA
ncbi:NAD(P)-binding Rossmann-fold superfamily protein [Thalictrum thalictroides]|uniref:NAD(P)-binding Rossmann-fold superfamily protein n=1 Tax=Thalictrum thalictroides TaxID=46969 RepID=A0A7J6VCQ3_THATH|nr:NAD(P)-binding Rossmann-fold superfamily protein [Thalictrum thalictroides]